MAPEVMDALAKAGVDARYVEIDTEFGHVASGPEWAKWGPALKTFRVAEGIAAAGGHAHATAPAMVRWRE